MEPQDNPLELKFNSGNTLPPNFKIILKISTIYFADNLPKNIVNLLGKTNVGIAKIKIVIRPTYKKILKINDLINCIKN